MQRATKNSIASRPATLVTPLAEERSRTRVNVERDLRESPSPTSAATPSDSERRRSLPIAIRQRIESRLAGRVRNLVVRVAGDSVVLEGECTTYYTKQLAQHAALAVLEDEHLDNAIVVNVPR